MNTITIHNQSPLGPDILDQDTVLFMFPQDTVEHGRVSDRIGQLNALSDIPTCNGPTSGNAQEWG